MIPKRRGDQEKTMIRNIGRGIIVKKIRQMQMRMIGPKNLMDLAATTRDQDGYAEKNLRLLFASLYLLHKH